MKINTTIIAILLACILCLLYLVYWNGKGVITVSAESLVCDQLDANKKCVFSPEATFTISVNPNTSACSIMEKLHKDNTAIFKNGQSLSFIDKENWECREKPTPSTTAANGFKFGNSQHVYQMHDGNLKIWIDDLDHIIGPTEYKIQKH